jgi:hypothetical protein
MTEFWFVRLKNEIIEIVLTIKEMICNPLMMILRCLWIVITFQEQNWIENVKQLAEKDRINQDNIMPNEFIQGVALTGTFSSLFQKDIFTFI